MASVMNQANIYAGVSVSGIYDLGPIRHCYINDKLKLDLESSRDYPPIFQVNHFGKPIDLFVGSAELPKIQAQITDFFRYRLARS